jgi:phosphoglycolate phosphatase
MQQTLKLMIFDLDGTLVDTAADLVASLDRALSLRGHPQSEPATARSWIGHGARQMIRNALEHHGVAFDDTLVEDMFRDFLDHYQANMSRFSRPFPALIEALDALADNGWTFAVCSNKQERLCRQLLDELDMSHRFATISGGDTFGVSKPDPGHLLGTIEAAAGDPRRAIMVGDASTDVDAARAASVPVIGVSFGYTPVPMVELEPDLLLDSFADLTPEIAEDLLREMV